ncbi:hypothetical protein O5O45_19220 [Hahella aquimaris]|uniref:RHS repeat domain-containing protein n=1 Tax=Hahella sp. HNIBRBA332 TaxID=3015983 RepID=UPI00273CC1D9|nr:hypothetical protein [Hahella sp. HNIBRBA332]WLQ11863.1 hypothetical protein O5O45_19220 [Hahella sp. HNIBRBA332]
MGYSKLKFAINTLFISTIGSLSIAPSVKAALVCEQWITEGGCSSSSPVATAQCGFSWAQSKWPGRVMEKGPLQPWNKGYVQRWKWGDEDDYGRGMVISGKNCHKANPPNKPPGNGAPPPDICTGNPVNALSGGKYQNEKDIEMPLGFDVARYYFFDNSIGKWGFSFDYSLTISDNEIKVNFPDSKVFTYVDSGQNNWVTDSNIAYDLNRVNNGEVVWVLSGNDGNRYNFNLSGKLISVITRDLKELDISIHPDIQRPVQLQALGVIVDILYNEQSRVASISSSDGQTVNYEYDSQGRLFKVSRFNAEGAFTKTYHYEHEIFSTALTGITDELGIRFATWEYDYIGRVTKSYHADKAELFQFDYSKADNASNPSVKITNPLGKISTYYYKYINGVRTLTQIEGDATANCAGANTSYTYDANGYVDLVTDWEGNITDYDYNERGLEVKRIEAKGAPEERVTLTEWHPTLRLPTKITEPGRITEFTYDDDGKLKSKSIQPVAAN